MDSDLLSRPNIAMLTSRSESAASFESNDSTLSRRDSEIIFTPYKADYRFFPMVDTKVLSTPMMVRNGASVSVDFLEHLGWAAR
jgi:hypothetical protein